MECSIFPELTLQISINIQSFEELSFRQILSVVLLGILIDIFQDMQFSFYY